MFLVDTGSRGQQMIDTRHLYDVRAAVRRPVRTDASLGTRSSNIVYDGEVTGERIRGRLLPGGGDWLLVDAAGIGHIDARYIIQTDDGAFVQVFYGGRLVFHNDALTRLRSGRPLEESDTYFRVAPTFNAPDAYGWLNNVQAIGIGRLEPGEDGGTNVHYRVFELL
jgi:Protein of unknown function (DUF3237)